MEDSKLELKIQNAVKTQWWIFIAFVNAIIIIVLLIGLPLSSGKGPREYPANYDTIKWVLIGLSIVVTLGKFWFQKNRLDKIESYAKCLNLDSITGSHFGNFIISMAFCEAVFLFGLVLFFLTYRMFEWTPLLILSGILFATSTPSMKKLRAIVDSHTAEQPEESFVGEVMENVALRGIADLDRALIPSLLIRSVAFIIDVLIVYGLLLVVVARMVAGEFILPEDANITFGVLNIVLFGVYQVLSIHFAGRTLGCLFTGVKVVSSDGSELTFDRALKRGLIMTLLLFFWPAGIPIFLVFHIGHIIITVRWGKNEFKQAEWDGVARTVVVKARAVEPS